MNFKKGLKALLYASTAMMAVNAAVPTASMLPIFAADETTDEGSAEENATLTIKNMPAGTSYSVYQIFSGDYSKEGKFTNPQFSDAGSNDHALENAFIIAVNTVFQNASEEAKIQNTTDKSVQATKWAKWLSDLNPSSEKTIALANQIATNFKSLPDVYKKGILSNSEEVTADSSSIELDTGYYVLVPDSHDTKDHDTTDAILIEIKNGPNVVYSKDSAGQPTVDKTSTTTGWSGDDEKAVFDLKYTIRATISNNIYDYDGEGKSYKYVITDILPEGLNVTAEELANQDDWNISIKFEPKAEGSTQNSYELSPKQAVSEITEGENNGRTQFTWTFDNLVSDLKGLKDAGLDYDTWLDYQIVVTYAPVFDETDKSNLLSSLKEKFEPMVNYVKVSFTNDPFAQGSGTLIDSPWDDDKVETYSISVIKTDDKANKIVGAEFEILNADGDVIKANQLDNNDASKFDFAGLVGGVTYRLREKTAPAGYTGVNDVYFKIFETKDENGNLLKDGDGNWQVYIRPTNENGEPLEDDSFPDYVILGATVSDEKQLLSAGISATVINKSNIGGLPITGQQGMMLGLVVGSIIIAVSAKSMLGKKKEEEAAK